MADKVERRYRNKTPRVNGENGGKCLIPRKKKLSKSFNLSISAVGKQSQSLLQNNNLSQFKQIVEDKRIFSDKKKNKNMPSSIIENFEKFSLLKMEIKKRKRLAQQIYEIRWKTSVFSYHVKYKNNMCEFWKDLGLVPIPPIQTFSQIGYKTEGYFQNMHSLLGNSLGQSEKNKELIKILKNLRLLHGF